MKRLSTTLFTVTLLLLPAAMVFEDQALPTWNSRLVIPKFELEPNLHTPKYFDGTFLPPSIKTDLTLSKSDNPILLTTETHIQPEVTVTFGPGTNLYANENTSLKVSGHLIVKGTQNMPVQLLSNEDHPKNQTWLGVLVESGGSASIQHAIIEDASPAVNCLEDSNVKVINTEIKRGALGVFQVSATCLIQNSFINGAQNGIVSIDIAPQIINTTINAGKKDIHEIIAQ